MIFRAASLAIAGFKQLISKKLVRLCGCTGWSAAFLLAYKNKARLSCDVAHFVQLTKIVLPLRVTIVSSEDLTKPYVLG